MTEAQQHRQVPEVRANLFSTVLDAMADGVMVVDDRLRLVLTNRAMREALLLAPGQHGRPLLEVLPEHDLSTVFSNVLDSGQQQTLQLRHRGIVDRVFDVLVVPLPDHDYWGRRGLGMFRDVTERLEIERLLMDFIANASHELRTPVTAILGYAETLAETPPTDPETQQRFAKTLHRQAQRLATLLGQLLDLRKLDSNHLNLHLMAFELRPFLAGVVAQHVDSAEAAGLSVKLSAPTSLSVRSDAEALAIVIGNLLQNAIKYTPPGGGRIEVKASTEPGGGVRIAVIDSGIGIAVDDQKRVFERFYRVDKGRSRRTGGVGLGLALVQELTRCLGGRIELQSRVGKGSTFEVILP